LKSQHPPALLVVGPPVIANVVPEAPTLRLSGMQIDVLLLGVHHKLDRGLPGWACDDHNLPTGPAHLFRPVTIKSLHERGLLDANFGDSRVHRGELVGAQNLVERAMNIHRKFLSSKCGPALLFGRLSNKRGCSLTTTSCSTTERRVSGLGLNFVLVRGHKRGIGVRGSKTDD